ncbi:hypothetical protein FBU31_005710, partial [Coemansia sp. 'formosensis']
MLDTRVGIVVDGALAHEYISAAKEGRVWAIESTPPLLRSLENALLSSLDLGNGRLVSGDLGLVPSYQPSVSFSVSVRVVSESGSACPELWVKNNGDCTLEQLDVCVGENSGDQRVWTAQWICRPVSEEGLHMSLHVRQSADALSALEGRRHDTPQVLDLFISRFSDSHAPPRATSPLGRAQVLTASHVFSETLQHHEHRSNSGEFSVHPLFGRWVAEDSPA